MSDEFYWVDEFRRARQDGFEWGARARDAAIELAGEFAEIAARTAWEPADWACTGREVWQNPSLLLDKWTYAGLLPVVPGSVKQLRKLGNATDEAADVARLANDVGNPLRLLNPGIKIPETQLVDHVLARHTINGVQKFANKSKFFGNRDDIVRLINEGTQQRIVVQPNGRYARTWDTGRVIGFDRDLGQNTSMMTVITEADGTLVTAFPGRPAQ